MSRSYLASSLTALVVLVVWAVLVTARNGWVLPGALGLMFSYGCLTIPPPRRRDTQRVVTGRLEWFDSPGGAGDEAGEGPIAGSIAGPAVTLR